ncbi:MAG: sterol desaturase family protein [Cyclobacteriaceae bacterium]|jgi:sterol desaturase/sphingolipid hydroxylase (fatty acid hydroxylase superfamily)
MKNFVSNSTESTRMFKSGFLESLSKVHYTVPLIVFIPTILYFGWTGLQTPGITTSGFILSLIGGLVFWTLTEYVLHRFVFHFVPSSKWGQRIHFIFHGVHHDYPNDAMRLVMPPSASIPLATLFYFLFYATVPALYLNSFFAAFLTGYLCYDMFHYAFHHGNFNNPILKKLKQHHMMHHYTDADKGYGVTSILWDIVFRSELKRKAE